MKTRHFPKWENESGSWKSRDWDGLGQMFQAKTMTNVRCGKYAVFGGSFRRQTLAWQPGMQA